MGVGCGQGGGQGCWQMAQHGTEVSTEIDIDAAWAALGTKYKGGSRLTQCTSAKFENIQGCKGPCCTHTPVRS